MTVPNIAPPEWLMDGNVRTNTFTFDERICTGRTPIMFLRLHPMSHPMGSPGLLTTLGGGDMDSVREDLRDFIRDLALIPGIETVTVQVHLVTIMYADALTPKEAHQRVDQLIADTWNILCVTSRTYDELEDNANGKDDWPELIG